MVPLFYTTYISLDLSHYEKFCDKVGGINMVADGKCFGSCRFTYSLQYMTFEL